MQKLAAELPEGLRDPGFAVLLRRIDESPVFEGNRARVFFRGPETFAAMMEAIDSAREEVLVESYIFKDDQTGRSFRDALSRAVERGAKVRVLADAFGSIATRRAFWKEMRRRGIEVRLFHPVFPHVLLQPFRDHRKILVVDGRISFTGGMNIGDEYGSSLSKHGGPWRDSHIRIEGPASWGIAIVFTEAWDAAGGSRVELPLLAPETGGVPVVVLDSRPFRGTDEMASVMAAIVTAARKRLWITNAYFAPRYRAVELLTRAARRGVDVRLLLPGRSDVSLVRHAGHGHFEALLKGGVRIFEYHAAILHAKTVVVDDHVSVIGSSNLDFRSFHLNAECNVLILDDATAGTLARAYEGDLEKSVEIVPSLWERRSSLHRTGDALARMMGPFL